MKADVSVSQLSHVLRGPMAVLSTGSVLADALEQPFERAVDMQVDRMNDMLTQASLLEYMQQESVPMQEVVYVSDAIMGAVAELEPQLSQKNIELRLTVGDFRLRGNEALFERMIFELLSNAIIASPEGGVVTVIAFVSAEGVELRVQDSGSGLQDYQSACKPFIRSTDSTGAGLGLTLVSRIADLHEATIRCSSGVVGLAGTTVRINLSKSRAV